MKLIWKSNATTRQQQIHQVQSFIIFFKPIEFFSRCDVNISSPFRHLHCRLCTSVVQRPRACRYERLGPPLPVIVAATAS